jgi:hypothetical protein
MPQNTVGEFPAVGKFVRRAAIELTAGGAGYLSSMVTYRE